MTWLPDRWPRLNRRGWALTAGTVTLVLAGRILGVFELFVLAGGAATLLVGALVLVGLPGPGLDATRRLCEGRIHAGTETSVELRVANTGRRRSWPVWLDDRLGPHSQASLLLPSLRSGGAEEAFYQLPPQQRGRHRIGPLQARLVDPFGLTQRVVEIAPASELLVYPRIDPLRPPDPAAGDDRGPAPRAPRPNGTTDDFTGLRSYQVGDDLRRVHWPSTARRDELIVRLHEEPRVARVAVVLDARGASHTTATFEAAVSATASILASCRRHRLAARLVTTSGHNWEIGGDGSHFEAVLAELAIIEPDQGGDLERLMKLASASSTTVVVTAEAGDEGRRGSTAGAGVTGRRRNLLWVAFDSSAGPNDDPVLVEPSGSARPMGFTPVANGGVLHVASPQLFASSWDRAMAASAAVPSR